MKKDKLININLTPITESLKKEYIFVDNELQDSIKKLNFFKNVKRYGKSKRRGYSIEVIIYALLVWVFLKNDSIKMFFEKARFQKSSATVVKKLIL